MYRPPDARQAFDFPEQSAVNSRVWPEMIPFHRHEDAFRRYIVPCPDPSYRGQRLSQIMLDVVHVPYPFDLVSDVKCKRHIPDAPDAKAACRIQGHEQQVVEMTGTDATGSQIQVRKVVCGKH